MKKYKLLLAFAGGVTGVFLSQAVITGGVNRIEVGAYLLALAAAFIVFLVLRLGDRRSEKE